MELIVNHIFLYLLRIVGTLQPSDRLSTPDRLAETRTNEKLFLKMLREKQALIWRITRIYCKIGEDQRDLFQDIVTRLWTGFPFFRGESSTTTWVYTVSLHTALERIRKKQPIWEALDNLPEASQPATRHEVDGRANLITILEQLGNVDKAIIFLMTEQYNNLEIATMVGLTPNTVMQRVHRLREKLKEQLTL